VFHQKQVEEAVLVDADPLSPVPLNAIIFHQHLKQIRLVTEPGPSAGLFTFGNTVSIKTLPYK
jgi:hypothetical protein